MYRCHLQTEYQALLSNSTFLLRLRGYRNPFISIILFHKEIPISGDNITHIPAKRNAKIYTKIAAAKTTRYIKIGIMKGARSKQQIIARILRIIFNPVTLVILDFYLNILHFSVYNIVYTLRII